MRAIRSSNQPLGASGDLRSRLLRHHVPLALASAVVLFLFMSLPLFDANVYPHGDLFSGTFPRQRSVDDTGAMRHGGGDAGPMRHRGGDARGMRHDGGDAGPMRHGGAGAEPMDRGGDHAAPDPDRMRHRSFTRQFTFATGYVATGFLGLTLLIGPANLLLRRRNPISSYLSRDIGTWAAIFSVAHVVFGLQVHGSGRIRDFLNFFIAPDGSPWTNSFGLGNWTGLAALVIVVGLLAISSDAALRKLRAKPWKRRQRLNYALFALVVLHAFFYGALLRVTSPFTLVLGLSVAAVFVGQAVGIWLWRRRDSGTTAAPA